MQIHNLIKIVSQVWKKKKKKGFETYMPPDEEHITHEAVMTKRGGKKGPELG